MSLQGLDDVKKMIAKNKLESNDKLRKIYFKGLSTIIKETPVDEGRARNNWFLTAKNPSGLVGRGGGSSGGSHQSLNNMPKNVLNKKIYFTNNLPYIGMLEYGGYGSKETRKTNSRGFSKLAPKGWVRIELVNMLNKVRAL